RRRGRRRRRGAVRQREMLMERGAERQPRFHGQRVRGRRRRGVADWGRERIGWLAGRRLTG
ncbi:hypothetical protein, partial [Catenulispora pinisilvae]|uniref:hypothetical protein n=1 Tax=Catenulispora pinisilvae TaxID=2705253 RepID=UPI001E4F0CD0